MKPTDSRRSRPPLVEPGRLTCSTICFRHLPLADALAAVRSLEFAEVDIGTLPGFCPHFDFTREDPAAERAFVATVRASGLRVHTFTTNIGEFNQPGVSAEACRAAGRRNIRVAAELGAHGINLNCGAWLERSEQPLADGIARVAAGIRALAPEAEAAGVRLMIEAPHKSKLCRDGDEALALLRAIDHPNVALILDINHHHAAGWRPARAVAAIGARNIGIVHLRDAIGRENRYPLGAGEVDWAELFRSLQEGGYPGRYSFEFTDAGTTRDEIQAVIRQSREYLRRLV